MKMKPMKLEGALKLYMVLYFFAFLFTFLMSIPMLLHVMPKSECLLFVKTSNDQEKKFEYGSPGGCMAAGILPLLVALGALGLMLAQWLQLRKLRAHLDNPEMSSDEYRAECRKTFWKMIAAHCCIGGLVLVIACILSAGYALTCRSIYLIVEKEIRFRISHTPNSNRGQQQVHENFASDQSFNRYTNQNLNTLGQNRHENSITCRSLLTDKTNHFELKKNHQRNDFYSQYYGFQNNDNSLSDIGNFEHFAFQDNLRLEMTLAGAWISAVLWSIILFLMVKERHHLRAHITDESMWGGGSDYGQGSVRSGKSRQSTTNRNLMTPIDFDVKSNASRISKASRSSKGTSYKDMGGSRSNKGSSSYKMMNGSTKSASAVPSRLTVSRLEQVPSLPPTYGVQKLLAGNMEPPNDTSSVADMSMATVTGAVFGPGVDMTRGRDTVCSSNNAAFQNNSLLDYFGQPETNPNHRYEDPPGEPTMMTEESDIM
eukprot:TRINITY_DN10752_c0_g1_i1.p1 TRINITY_DN10752_c0_g1~~TRINITY_DN10752_c0_g1_i1.p1  ORF type:complete len:485 (+),score=71.77 TRINITY_DN10752_c0_g1_i1:100-1554(+)